MIFLFSLLQATSREYVNEVPIATDQLLLTDDDDNAPSWFREIRRTDEETGKVILREISLTDRDTQTQIINHFIHRYFSAILAWENIMGRTYWNSVLSTGILSLQNMFIIKITNCCMACVKWGHGYSPAILVSSLIRLSDIASYPNSALSVSLKNLSTTIGYHSCHTVQ